MNKVALLILALAISYASGQCTDLVKDYFSAPAIGTNAAAVGTDLKSCKSLKSKTICCAATYFDNFGTREGVVQKALEDGVKPRDEAILAARKAIAGQMANYAKFTTAVANSKDTLTKWAATAPDNTITTQNAKDVQTGITKLTTLWDDFFKNYNAYYTGFDTYRKSRASCFTEVLKTVVSSWCLPCLQTTQRADYGIALDATPSVTDINFGDDVKKRLAAACQPYFVASDQQSNILIAGQYATGIEAKTTALNKIAAATPAPAGVTDYLAVNKVTPTVKPSAIEAACTTTQCDWIFTNVFAKGLLKNDPLILGGADDSANARRRVLADERQLQTNSKFEPATDEAIITISFPEVVGDIKNTRELSALRVGVFSCIVAFFVALLI